MDSSHLSATKLINVFQAELNSCPIETVTQRIINLTDGLTSFWSSAEGWAPIESAQLLSRSRLDWQVSLARSLNMWLVDPPEEERDGKLILAWANLRSLVEGSLKLFVSVWYHDYKDDVNAFRPKDTLVQPDSLELEKLRQFFIKKIWDESWNTWVGHIQQRGNAIHAFKNREIGNFEELRQDIRIYLRFLRYINYRLPYPDDEIYMPRE